MPLDPRVLRDIIKTPSGKIYMLRIEEHPSLKNVVKSSSA